MHASLRVCMYACMDDCLASQTYAQLDGNPNTQTQARSQAVQLGKSPEGAGHHGLHGSSGSPVRAWEVSGSVRGPFQGSFMVSVGFGFGAFEV